MPQASAPANKVHTVIRRTKQADNFTTLPNALIRDTRLSRFTRSCLIEALSNDPKWQEGADWMWQQAETKGVGRRGEGRDAYRKAFKEMEAAGYLTRHKYRRPDGVWQLELDFTDTPDA